MDNQKYISLIIKIITRSANSAEKMQFKEWFSSSDTNQEFYNHIHSIWNDVEVSYDNIEFDEDIAINKIRKEIENKRKDYKLKKISFIYKAASVILIVAFCVGVYIYLKKKSNDIIVYQADDMIKEIVLPDNSHIWLNRNSKIYTPEMFSKNIRKVKLEGEAFFKISKDKNKPFIVQAGKTIVKVLGTSFNVDYNTKFNDVRVTVKTGKVAFYKNTLLKQSYILLPGYTGYFSDVNDYVSIRSNNNPNYLSWISGTLVFYDTSLTEVCQTLSKHFNKNIRNTIKDSELTLTGNFINETLDNILDIISITLNIKVVKLENEIILKK